MARTHERTPEAIVRLTPHQRAVTHDDVREPLVNEGWPSKETEMPRNVVSGQPLVGVGNTRGSLTGGRASHSPLRPDTAGRADEAQGMVRTGTRTVHGDRHLDPLDPLVPAGQVDQRVLRHCICGTASARASLTALPPE